VYVGGSSGPVRAARLLCAIGSGVLMFSSMLRACAGYLQRYQ